MHRAGGAKSPPVHVHNRTDEGFYVLTGKFGFLWMTGRSKRPLAHMSWCRKDVRIRSGTRAVRPPAASFVMSPPGFEGCFRELAQRLAAIESEEAAMQLRRQLSARYDIEVVGPPVETR